MEKIVEKLGKVTGKISYIGCLVGSVGVFILMGFSVLSVIMRKVGYPIGGSLNLTIYILIAVVYISLAYPQFRGEHISVDLLVSRFKGKVHYSVIIIGLSIALAACSFLVWSGCTSALYSFQVRERMDGVPFYPIYPSKIILGIGLILLWVQLLADLLKAIFIKEKAAVVKTDAADFHS